MARCSYCGRKTELHEAWVPTCTACSARLKESGPRKVRSVHSQLIQELLQATAEHDSATAAHDLRVAKERLARAHTRLSDFLDRGIIPEDLKVD